ncbi:MAG: RecX family transcriptional regulator [Acidobacteriota bacterium]|nr:MAG: RecX family transcriptional regulator [Acidobacteriota bacterium]
MPRYKPIPRDEDRNVPDPEKAAKLTFDRAVNLLTFKPRSEEELRTRLLEKPWTNAEIVEDVIVKLKKYGYIDDDDYAKGFAVSKLKQKPVGRYRLQQELKRKKLDEKTIEGALDEAFEEIPEEDLIERAIEKRIRVRGEPRDRAEKKKLFDHLARLGFGYDLIRESIERIRTEDE